MLFKVIVETTNDGRRAQKKEKRKRKKKDWKEQIRKISITV
jgi:hypothetical protein